MGAFAAKQCGNVGLGVAHGSAGSVSILDPSKPSHFYKDV